MKRRDRLREQGRIFGPLCDYVRSRQCCVPGCPAPGSPHHVHARGMGGSVEDWLPIIRRTGRVLEFIRIVGNVAPLCHHHHQQLHQGGVMTFARQFNVSLTTIAKGYGDRFAKKHPAQFAELDELYAGYALRNPELCFPAGSLGIEAA